MNYLSQIKKILRILSKITLYSTLIILIYIMTVNAIVVFSSKGYIDSNDDFGDEKFDCILVLGAGVWENSRPSAMLEDRLITAINLYNQGIADKILMSGDNGQDYYDEVNVMKNYAIDKGVPSKDIFMDHAGFSTYESLYRAKNIFQVESVLIVTQKYHLYRAVYTAGKFDIKVYGVSAEKREYSGQTMRDIREIFARNKDFIYSLIKPEPTFLGEIIPIDGDGDITNDKPDSR